MTPRPQLDHNAADRPGVELLIRGARLFDPAAKIDQTADLLVRGGEVAEIGQDIDRPDGAEVVDADGLHAFPAFVDPHVHLRTPGREDEEDIESGTRAAAAGGYCAIIAQPNTDPVVDTASIVESLRERARSEARVPTGFMAAITRGQEGEHLTEMAELAATGAFGFTDDGRPVVSAGVLRQALQYQRLAGLPIALHEEDPSLSAGGAMHEGAVSALLGIGGIPSISESTMIARDAAIAGYESGRIHIQHVSARESVVAVEQAKQAGVQITAEVSPHHLTLTDEAVRALDANVKMNPPLRAEADRQALIEALRSGAMDFIATDHAPHSREEKEQPFETAPFGITGLETAFSVLYTALVKPGVLPLELIVAKLSAGAPVFGIDLPTLAPGADANITLVDLDAQWQVGEAGYESRSANSAWAGETLSARVRMTVAAGGVAYRERSFAIGAVA
ncbi:MAG: dihydroorotase [Thermoleophilales bacterium]|nr:dihydroorotase [Thermoleophilales bacterium]